MSRCFPDGDPRIPHLVRGPGGLKGEVWDLRGDIEKAFQCTEAELDNLAGIIETARTWTTQTNSALEYAGGFYDFATGVSGDDDFSPSITWGDADVGVAAHFFVVLGGATSDELIIRITGDSIDDEGNQILGDIQDIVIPEATPLNSYFETSKKWNGEITVEVVSGTPVTCNYGWAKYHDFANRNFRLLSFEALWASDATDSGSDIHIIHHRTTGWTFVAGGPPTHPGPAFSRSVDHAGNNVHRVGTGAWKRTNLSLDINGAGPEGLIIEIHSGSTGLGSLSFRLLTVEVAVKILTPTTP